MSRIKNMVRWLVPLFFILITLIPIGSASLYSSNRATIGGVITYPDVIFVEGNDTQTIGGVIGPGRIFFKATNLTLVAGSQITIEESVRVQCNNHTNTVSMEWVSDTFDSSCKNITIWLNDIKAVTIGDNGEGSTISNSQLMPKDSTWVVRIMTEMDAGWESGNYSIVLCLTYHVENIDESFESFADGELISTSRWTITGNTTTATFKAKDDSGNKVGHYNDQDAASQLICVLSVTPLRAALDWHESLVNVRSIGTGALYTVSSRSTGGVFVNGVRFVQSSGQIQQEGLTISNLGAFSYNASYIVRITFPTLTTFTVSINGTLYGPFTNAGTKPIATGAFPISELHYKTESTTFDVIEEDFELHTVGNTISGSPSIINWQTVASGTAYSKCASFNMGYGASKNMHMFDDVTESVYTLAAFETESPQVPSASYQYVFKFNFYIDTYSCNLVEINQLTGFLPAGGENIKLSWNADGKVYAYYSGAWTATGLTWALDTYYSVLIQVTSTTTFSLSLNGGATWATGLTNNGIWNATAKQMTWYTGAAGAAGKGDFYVDNVDASWTVMNSFDIASVYLDNISTNRAGFLWS